MSAFVTGTIKLLFNRNNQTIVYEARHRVTNKVIKAFDTREECFSFCEKNGHYYKVVPRGGRSWKSLYYFEGYPDRCKDEDWAKGYKLKDPRLRTVFTYMLDEPPAIEGWTLLVELDSGVSVYRKD